MHSWGIKPCKVWWSVVYPLVKKLTATWSGTSHSSKIQGKWIGQDCRLGKSNREIFSWVVKLWNALCCHFLAKWQGKEILAMVWAQSPRILDSWPRRKSGDPGAVAKMWDLAGTARKSNYHSNRFAANCTQIYKSTQSSWLSNKTKTKLRQKSSLWSPHWSSRSSFKRWRSNSGFWSSTCSIMMSRSWHRIMRTGFRPAHHPPCQSPQMWTFSTQAYPLTWSSMNVSCLFSWKPSDLSVTQTSMQLRSQSRKPNKTVWSSESKLSNYFQARFTSINSSSTWHWWLAETCSASTSQTSLTSCASAIWPWLTGSRMICTSSKCSRSSRHLKFLLFSKRSEWTAPHLANRWSFLPPLRATQSRCMSRSLTCSVCR